ncbi:MAG: Ig domain-containing protein, partial [Longimicrobiales bacterium]|nr:Ig domain-containing protein [Longimicrobiales bacterium]
AYIAGFDVLGGTDPVRWTLVNGELPTGLTLEAQNGILSGVPQAVGRFDFPAGGVRCPACAAGAGGPRLGPGARAQVAALLAGEVPSGLARLGAHLQLLADFLGHHVSEGRPSEAFRVLAAFLPPEHPADDGAGGARA